MLILSLKIMVNYGQLEKYDIRKYFECKITSCFKIINFNNPSENWNFRCETENPVARNRLGEGISGSSLHLTVEVILTHIYDGCGATWGFVSSSLDSLSCHRKTSLCTWKDVGKEHRWTDYLSHWWWIWNRLTNVP